MKNTNTKTLTRVALLVAIELVMKLVGLGSVPVGPLYMSFLTLPIAVGAISEAGAGTISGTTLTTSSRTGTADGAQGAGQCKSQAAHIAGAHTQLRRVSTAQHAGFSGAGRSAGRLARRAGQHSSPAPASVARRSGAR